MFLVPVHEQDLRKGPCAFRVFFQQTPEKLQKKHRIYDTLAVPLYPSPEHRRVSLRYALRNMGAVPKQPADSMWARAMRLGSPVNSMKLPTWLKCWRRDPLMHTIEPDENGHLPLTHRSQALSNAAQGSTSAAHAAQECSGRLTSPNFHYEKRLSRRPSAPRSTSEVLVGTANV